MHLKNTGVLYSSDTGNQLKPEIITYYDGFKSGVDVIYEKCDTYSTLRRCRRWPLVSFYRRCGY